MTCFNITFTIHTASMTAYEMSFLVQDRTGNVTYLTSNLDGFYTRRDIDYFFHYCFLSDFVFIGEDSAGDGWDDGYFSVFDNSRGSYLNTVLFS